MQVFGIMIVIACVKAQPVLYMLEPATAECFQRRGGAVNHVCELLLQPL